MLNPILFAIFLLLIGFVLRALIKPLQWLFIPASIVGGLIGLLLVQSGSILDSLNLPSILLGLELKSLPNSELIAALKSWPGILISVVFAGMFLTKNSNSAVSSLRSAGQEGIVVWIVVLGQTAIGLLCTWLLIQPFFDNIPNSFGMLIETGFAGGHGTAAAMGSVYESDIVNLDNGLDLGLFMATIGLLFSVVSGIIYVNLAIRFGWVAAKTQIRPISGLENRKRPDTIARGTVAPEAIDPLLFQLLLLGLAFGLGHLAREGVVALSKHMDASFTAATAVASDSDQALKSRTSFVGTVGDFPLFIYTLFGGLFVRRLLVALRLDDLIDSLSIHRLTGIAMDFLVVSAIASLKIEAIADVATPLIILLVAAFAWTGFCLLFIARRLLPPGYWFELGILNYGMSTGTTATGFTLLKIVDGELESGAAEDYALAAPLSSPFIGGGMLTVGLPMLVLESFHIAIPTLILSTIVVALYFLGMKTRPSKQVQ